jgi:ATP-binding cassette subfamily F protein uup
MAAPPRNIVSLERVGKAYGAGPVLDGVSLGIAGGDRIGVVGRNGGGKSTLLGLIARTEEPDSGLVTHAAGLRVALLGQTDLVDPQRTIREEVIGGRADHEWAGDPRIRDVLEGTLGGVDLSRFPQGLDTVIGPLSGGERRRVALAKLLLDGPDLLLLDEPTNHLDLEGVDWLARHLAARRGALVVVTHDRWFLDAVCERTWEVNDAQVLQHEGAYAAWVLARAERERQAAAGEERRRNLLRKELAWLRRGPPARTTKPKFRIEAANALIADAPPIRDRAELLRFATARLGKTVLDVDGATVQLGDRTILRRLSWQLGPGDRVGVVGVNGSGKTTLLRLLAGELEASEGAVRTGSTVRIAALSQHLEELDGGLRVLEALEAVRPRVSLGDGRELTASQLCERFGFGGNRQWTFVADLSGGERRRLQLMRLLMDEPNVLLLDEPTNDLDIDTLTALEDLLDGWAGSLVVVSHDRYFVERVCTDVFGVTAAGGLAHLPGGIEQYVEQRHEQRAAEDAAAAAAAKADVAPVARGNVLRQARKDADRLERELTRLAERESELHDLMAEHATNYERVAALDAELRDLRARRAEAEEAWMVAAEALDVG